MKNNAPRRRGSMLFSLLVTLLSFVLVILISAAVIRSAPSKGGYKTEPSMILYDLQKGRYTDALSAAAENRSLGVDERASSDYAAPYAVCDYFEAYSYYAAYSRVGDAEKAAYYEGLMDNAYARMGALQYMAEDIRAAFE